MMTAATCGTTTFEFDPDFSGKVKISTAEGSVVAVPGEDLLKFVANAFVIPARRLEQEKKGWRELLVG